MARPAGTAPKLVPLIVTLVRNDEFPVWFPAKSRLVDPEFTDQIPLMATDL